MVLTLRFSKKAKSVTATTIDLSRQAEGRERFASTLLARIIVRRSIELSNGISRITPPAVSAFIGKRFDAEKNNEPQPEKMAFDLVRASVNLVVASILIAIGTSLKLPLSTTYVTFMVAMGTSLADGAWGRESAVYRITGVLTVIGGWFFTAFSAFLISFIIAALIFFGKWPVMLLLCGVSVYILIRTHAFHHKRSEKEAGKDGEQISTTFKVLNTCNDEVKHSVREMAAILHQTYIAFPGEDLKTLKKLKKDSKKLAEEIGRIRENMPATLRRFEETDIDSGHHYVQVVTYLKEMSNSLTHLVEPAFTHVDNNHAVDTEQTRKLKEFNDHVKDFFTLVSDSLDRKNGENPDELQNRRDKLINMANDILVQRIKILKKSRKGVKVSVTYIEILTETRNLLLSVVQLVRAHGRLIDSFAGIDTVRIGEVAD